MRDKDIYGVDSRLFGNHRFCGNPYIGQFIDDKLSQMLQNQYDSMGVKDVNNCVINHNDDNEECDITF